MMRKEVESVVACVLVSCILMLKLQEEHTLGEVLVQGRYGVTWIRPEPNPSPGSVPAEPSKGRANLQTYEQEK